MLNTLRSRRVYAAGIAIVMALYGFGFATPIETRAAPQAQKVSGTLRAALAAAAPGAIIELEPRAYAEGHIEITAAGTADAPIILRGAGLASVLAGRLTFKPGAAHWVLENFRIDASGQTVDAIRLNVNVHHVTLKALTINGGSMYGVRLEDGVHDVAIDACEISGFRNSGTDAHGIGIQVAHAITITNSIIHHNSGDGVQSHTNDTPGAGNWASGIVIVGNTIFANGENAIDIKSTHGALIQANRMYSYTAATGGEGVAVQIQYDAQDIDIRSNVIYDAVMGIELTRGRKQGADYPKAPSNIRIVGNLIRDVVNEAGFTNAGNGTGLVFRGSSNVLVANNTVLRAPTAAMYMGAGSTGELIQGLVVRNNIFQGVRNDLNYNSDFDTLGGPSFSHNHFVSGRVRDKALGQWTSVVRDAQLTTGDAVLDANGMPSDSSPAIDSGLGIGLPFAGAAPDRGWGEFAAGSGQILPPLPTSTPGPTLTPDPTLVNKLFIPVVRRR